MCPRSSQNPGGRGIDIPLDGLSGSRFDAGGRYRVILRRNYRGVMSEVVI